MKKIIASAVALALVVSASSASAQSIDIASLLAQIQALQAQIAALTGGSSVSTGATLTKDLAMGARDAEVMTLQKWLNAKGTPVATTGVGSMGYETNYFGAKTKAALMAYQAWANLPVTGMVDSWTRAKLNGGTVTTTPTGTVVVTPTSSVLAGGETALEDYDASTSDESDVEEGETAKIFDAEFDVEDADAQIQRVDVYFQGETGEETDPWEVFENVSLYANGKKIATIATDKESVWSEQGSQNPEVYRLRFNGLNTVAKEGTTVELTVEVEVSSTVDDLSAAWNVMIPDEGIRVLDGTGLDSYIGESGADETDLEASGVDFTIVEAGQDEELTVSEASNNPDSTTLVVDESTISQWYTLLKFEVKGEESDIVFNDFPVTLTSSDSNISTVIDDIELVLNGKVISDFDSIPTGTTGTTTFDVDEDVTIKANSRVTGEIRVRFKGLTGNYLEGATISADISSTNVSYIDAEGKEDITDLNGSANGDDFYLRTSGIAVESGIKSATVDQKVDTTATDDTGIYTIEFKVTAFDEDAFVELDSVFGTTTTGSGANFIVEGTDNVASTTIAAGALSSTLAQVSGGTRTGNFVKITDGQSATFRLTVNFDPAHVVGTAANYRIQLYSVNTNTTATAASAIGQVVAPEENFETADKNISN